MVSRKQRQALHREYEEYVNGRFGLVPVSEIESFTEWAEHIIIETRSKLAAARRAGEGEA